MTDNFTPITNYITSEQLQNMKVGDKIVFETITEAFDAKHLDDEE